jgi:hypothetical protein
VLYSLLLPIGPNDFWYHARAGRAIGETGQIPTTNLFTTNPPWVSPQTPFHYQSWIAEWLIYQTLKWGGLSGIVIQRSLCLVIAWIFITWAAWRRAKRALENLAVLDESWQTPLAQSAAAGALLAMLMGCNNFDTRPQMYSVPLFGFLVWAIFEWAHTTPSQRRWLVAAIALSIGFWANLHGAFFTSLLLLGALVAGEVIYARLAPASMARAWGEKLTPSHQKALLAVFVLAALAVLFNPRGAEIYAYVWKLANNQTGQKYIQEWQAPEFSLTEWHSLLFYLTLPILVLLWLLVRGRARSSKYFEDTKRAHPELGFSGVRVAELLVLSVLLTMALRDKRSILWFGMCAAPLWSALLISLRGLAVSRKQQPQPVPRATWFFNAALGALLCSSVVPLLPQFKASLPWPPEFRQRFAPTPQGEFPLGFGGDPPLLLENSTPVRAVEFWKRNPPRGRIWHVMDYGSYMMWALDGYLMPTSDPRIELYPDSFWDEYARLMNGPADAPYWLKQRDFSDALLATKLHERLIVRLKQAGWKVVLQNEPWTLLRAG